MMIEIKTKNITFMKIKTKKLNEEDSNDDMQTDLSNNIHVALKKGENGGLP